ncbi:MAG: aminopeptidase P family protein [Gemmatimonadetes bacterium]|nr:aminopeptidase P family protein [Gemmatimonadota bacterium]NNM07044.1 aminopeptidase P family protein [Gemmatimonadota bacterium]
MFARDTYVTRREVLQSQFDGGLLLFLGNSDSPMNYADNPYHFRQDSTFLYYFGLDQADLAAIIDVDAGTTTIFGDELSIDYIVWMGDLPTIASRAESVGATDTKPRAALAEILGRAVSAGRAVHFLPPYRAETKLQLMELLVISPEDAGTEASTQMIRAVVNQRNYKTDEEVAEIEKAVATSVSMHEAAIRMARPEMKEMEISAEVERIAMAAGGSVAFPVIATINGQTLHNHFHGNTISEGDLFLLDTGAQTASGYAGDLTTTFPVSSHFSEEQKAVYEIMLSAYDAAVSSLAPGVSNRDVHFTACRVIFDGMKGLGIMKGDTEEALAAGAHAIVMPHGIGHMMGMDVHDMENLGEAYVGYAGDERSTQFGLKSLRLTRPLEPGFVLTIEPGIYFIPQLIDVWAEEKALGEFIDYDELNKWRDFGGVRNEEDYLITSDGAMRLGPRKPQTVDELEALRQS